MILNNKRHVTQRQWGQVLKNMASESYKKSAAE